MVGETMPEPKREEDPHQKKRWANNYQVTTQDAG